MKPEYLTTTCTCCGKQDTLCANLDPQYGFVTVCFACVDRVHRHMAHYKPQVAEVVSAEDFLKTIPT